MGARKQGRRRKDGSEYVISKHIPDAFLYTASINDIIQGINSDPDLDPVEKMKAIRQLSGMDTDKAAPLIEKLYRAAYGTHPNNNTPLSNEIRKLIGVTRALY